MNDFCLMKQTRENIPAGDAHTGIRPCAVAIDTRWATYNCKWKKPFSHENKKCVFLGNRSTTDVSLSHMLGVLEKVETV